MIPFRKGYPMHWRLQAIIPATEDPLVIPCSAYRRSDGSHVFDGNVGYCNGDKCYLKNHVDHVQERHPTWEVRIVPYR